MNSPLDTLSPFALALAAEDYLTTLSLLPEQCQYDSPTGLLIGPAAIVTSYQGNGDDARQRFDSIECSHSIATFEAGWYLIEFIDEFCVRTKTHEFRCRQRVRLDRGLIDRIVHVAIPEQRELLNAFLRALE